MTTQATLNGTVPGVVGDVEAIRTEIAAYRRELPRLIAQGQAGRIALIKGDDVLSIWDTSDDAYQAGVAQFGSGPFLAQPIDPRDLTRPFPQGF